MSETVGARLREAGVRCNSVSVELKDWRFASLSHQCILPKPTDSTSVLYDTARRLLQEFWDKTPVRLIGLRTAQIQEDSFEQMSLFTNEHQEKMRAMEKAVDAIRGRFGIDSIQRASFLKEDSPTPHAISRQKHLRKASDTIARKEP